MYENIKSVRQQKHCGNEKAVIVTFESGKKLVLSKIDLTTLYNKGMKLNKFKFDRNGKLIEEQIRILSSDLHSKILDHEEED